MSQKHIFLFGNVYQRNRSKVTCESVVWPKLAYPLIPPDMKHPKSPDSMDDSVPAKCRETKEGEEEQEGRKTTVGHRAKRERRQGGSGGSSSATMCQVCNIQLNSSAQAQIDPLQRQDAPEEAKEARQGGIFRYGPNLRSISLTYKAFITC